MLPLTDEGGGGTAAKPITDCQKFVAIVQQIANESQDVNSFLDKLASTFTGANNSHVNEMSRNANKSITGLPGRIEFGPSNLPSAGFKEQYRDRSNQPRHFIGGFIAVARGGLPGHAYMQYRENSKSSDDAADLRLNQVSGILASRFIIQPLVPDLTSIRADLAHSIKREICE